MLSTDGFRFLRTALTRWCFSFKSGKIRRMDMRKLVLVLVLFLTIGCGWYVYKTQIEIHPYIEACSNLVKSKMKSPSSYQLNKASMVVTKEEGDPFILLEYESKNSFGASIAGNASFKFCYKEDPNQSKIVADAIRMLNNGKSPFAFMNICSGQIEGHQLTQLELYSIPLKRPKDSDFFSRPLPGSVTFEEGTMKFSRGMLTYSPDKFFPYE